jgi:predicted nucleic acid-binding protein
VIYFDSSYMAKCYLNEVGSIAVRQLAETEEARLDIVLAQFEADDAAGVWTWLPVTAELCRNTATRILGLPASTLIRSGDGLHLTTAAENGFTEIYSNDRHLLAAATFFGLQPRNVIL